MSKEKEDQKDEGSTEEVVVPEKLKSLVSEIEKMNVMDLVELVKVLEKKFGVSAAAPAAVAAVPASGDTTEESTEKSSFDIVLTGVGEQKIEVIKVVRDVTGLGLKGAKDLVDKAEQEAQKVKEGAKKEEAEEIKQKLEGAGAKVELK